MQTPIFYAGRYAQFVRRRTLRMGPKPANLDPVKLEFIDRGLARIARFAAGDRSRGQEG